MLRAATPDDAEGLAATVAEGFESYRAFAPAGWSPPGRLELGLGMAGRLLQDDVASVVAVDDGGAMAGHAVLIAATRSRVGSDDPTLGHLEQLFVRRAHWGDGTATRLLAWVVDEARRRPFAALRLMTPAAHLRALRFYEREGWSVRGEARFEETLGLELVEMRRALGAVTDAPRAPC